jgi:hypothetical protein
MINCFLSPLSVAFTKKDRHHKIVIDESIQNVINYSMLLSRNNDAAKQIRGLSETRDLLL